VAGRRRRRHSAEFKGRVVEECRRPGVSMAAVALANGVNANLLRRWVVQSNEQQAPATQSAPCAQEFIALAIASGPEPAAPAHIRIELRRGATTISVSWPAHAAGDCAAWLRDWLR
jgi:transposase-like protein